MKPNMLINKWSVLILGIWLLCALVAAITRAGETMAYAFWATVLIGIGYMFAYH